MTEFSIIDFRALPISGVPGSIGIHAHSTEISNELLGMEVKAVDRSSDAVGIAKFVYLKGVANTVQGSLVLINRNDLTTTLATANDVGYLAVAMAPTVAGEAGWYQVTGKAAVKGLTGLVADASLYLTATPGSVDDAVVAGDRIKGYCKTLSDLDTPSTGLVWADIHYPYVDNGEAA